MSNNAAALSIYLQVYAISAAKEKLVAMLEQPPRDDPVLKPLASAFMDMFRSVVDSKATLAHQFAYSFGWQAICDISASGKLPALSSANDAYRCLLMYGIQQYDTALTALGV